MLLIITEFGHLYKINYKNSIILTFTNIMLYFEFNFKHNVSVCDCGRTDNNLFSYLITNFSISQQI